jgi:hypothetical protein
MPLISRAVLLISAALCGGFFALSSAGFSWAAEPDQFSNSTLVFWFVAGMALAIPLWLPAVVPACYPRFLKVCRRTCAVLLLYPTWLFGTIVDSNVGRILSGFSFTPIALAQGSILTGCCLVCLFVLLWPEFRRHVDRTT